MPYDYTEYNRKTAKEMKDVVENPDGYEFIYEKTPKNGYGRAKFIKKTKIIIKR